MSDDNSLDSIQIPFSLDRSILPMSVEFNLPHRLKFWDSVVRPWLKKYGYTMYEFGFYDNETLHWCWMWPSVNIVETASSSPGPYAFYDKAADPNEVLEMNPPPYASDSVGRSEIQVLQTLFKKQKLFAENAVPGIIPIIDLLPFGGHWLVVMPRWGMNPRKPWSNTVGEILVYIRSLLQGLVSLHGYRIVHQDIANRNILINHFPISEEWDSEMRPNLRRDGRAKYALYDFDLSRIVPAGIDRLSYKDFPILTDELDLLDDFLLGQYDFDPFACDVALLGLSLVQITGVGHHMYYFLVPLTDKMLTWEVEKRLTAQQALCFFDDMFSELTATDLERPPALREFGLDVVGYWGMLSPDQVARWAHMRSPLRPRWRRFLHLLCKNRIGRYLTHLVRRMMR
ncbi:hypothetical protein BDZ94DRAFT_1310301 [Collybia nuda]|uniref:Protein kinase domain-containing protein n=1 Tax=Collybia nuda TaxID=64659 RepID=A0A9P5Y344_9AGAR|nr:hypothetical protein BDZ94DRAFT_1310301 [Collybia nuda]